MKVYTLENKSFEFDDLTDGCFSIKYISLDKDKIIKEFNKQKNFYTKVIEEQQKRTDVDDNYRKSYQVYRNELDYFEAWCGKWCYEYSINEYQLI